MEIQKTIMMDKAIELIHYDGVRAALSEFWEWYRHYKMPAVVELNENLVVHIYHDVTEEIESCVIECIEQTKGLVKKVDEEKIKESCSSGCFYDVVGYTNAMFDDIRQKLFKYLNKYGVKYEWKEGWEDVYRYLEVTIFPK